MQGGLGDVITRFLHIPETAFHFHPEFRNASTKRPIASFSPGLISLESYGPLFFFILLLKHKKKGRRGGEKLKKCYNHNIRVPPEGCHSAIALHSPCYNEWRIAELFS